MSRQKRKYGSDDVEEEEEDDEESSVRSGAHFRGDGAKPALFCFLMFDSNDPEKTTSIETSMDPTLTVLEYKSGNKKHRKGGRGSPKDWCLEQWIGPFRRPETAEIFRNRWSHCQKSLAVRMIRGAQLAIECSGEGEARLLTYSMHPKSLSESLRIFYEKKKRSERKGKIQKE